MKNAIRGNLMAGAVALAFAFLNQADALGAEKKGAEQELKKLEEEICKAYVKKDISTLEKVFSEEYTSVQGDGRVYSRKQELDKLRPGGPTFDTVDFEEIQVKQYGDLALVTGRSSFSTRGIKANERLTDVWAQRDGRWQLILTHATAIEPGAKSSPKAGPLREQLLGGWELVSSAEGQPLDPDFAGQIKLLGEKNWGVSRIDAATKKLAYCLGGTYTLNGDEYVETIEYGTEGLTEMIGQKFTFKIKIDGDKFTQIGVGNPYSQIFKRAK